MTIDLYCRISLHSALKNAPNLILSLVFFALAGAGHSQDTASTGETKANEAKEEKPAGLFFEKRVLNIAHRGGLLVRPEHTLEAYRHALDVGADVLELDVHSTADGVLISMHDDTVDDTTEGGGKVHAMTFVELQELDAGHTFTRDGGETFPYRGKGLKVLAVQDVFAEFPKAHYVIEIKQHEPPIVKPLLKLIEDSKLTEKVILTSFIDDAIAEVRKLNPKIKTSFTGTELRQLAKLSPASLASYKRPPSRFLQVPSENEGKQVITKQLMGVAKLFGLRVHVWTINDPEEMQRMIELGVHGMFTDDSAVLARVLDGK